jgi:hypothetical protein
MKNRPGIILMLFLASVSYYIQAQIVPQKMSYQAVARDAAGNPIANRTIGLRFTIREASAGGPDLYSETMTTTTNSMGTFNVEVGGGAPTLGSFNSIPWSNGPKFLNIKLDPNGGTTYTDMGSYQLLSVAYAQYAKDVLNNDDADASPTNEIQSLSVVGNQLSISSGNTVTLPSSGGGSITGTPNKVVKFTSVNTGGDSQLFDDGSFMGIGTTYPIGSERFRLNYDANASGWAGMNISSNQSTGKPFLSFGNANTLLGWMYFDGNDANKFKFYQNGQDRLCIDALGKFGLGTIAPTQYFNLYTAADNAYMSLNTASSGTTTYDGFLLGSQATSNTAWIWNYENSQLILGTNNAVSLTLQPDGRVNVGSSLPGAGLFNAYGGGAGLAYPAARVVNPAANGIALYSENNSTDATAVFTNASGATAPAIMAKFFDGGAGDLVRIDNYLGESGRISLWGASTGTAGGGDMYGHDIYGLVFDEITSSTGIRTQIFNIDFELSSQRMLTPWTSGNTLLGSTNYKWQAVWATNGVIQTSDERDKENIQALGLGLNAVMQLKPVSFQWKRIESRIGTGTNLGFIAQELEKVIPDAVIHTQTPAEEIQKAKEAGRGELESDSYGVKYSEIIPVLVKAIQEQQATIESLQKEVNELKSAR